MSDFFDPMDCGPPGSSVFGDFPGKDTGVACHALLQGIFPTQGSNSGISHYKWLLYHLSHLSGGHFWDTAKVLGTGAKVDYLEQFGASSLKESRILE